MNKSIPVSHAAERVAEHIYNMDIPSQTEILNMNFGVDVHDDPDHGVVYEGILITDSQFEQHLMMCLENMNHDTIIELWEEITGYSCEFDNDGNIVWEE